MIYILEGPDGVGKTTLANEILKRTKGHLLHATFDDNWNIKEYHRELIRIAKQLSKYQDVVLDRWAISELVYGNVFRSGPSYNVNDFIFEEIYPGEVVWIYCRNDNAVENHLKNQRTRKEMFESMEQVVEEYDKVIKETHYLNWRVYDYDKIDRRDFVKGLLK